MTERIRAQKSLKVERERLKKLHHAVDRFQSCQTEEELYETTLEVTRDEVLKEVSNLLRANVREADTVVRYGGDEFFVMLPETDGDSRYTGDRIRSKLEDWNNESNLLDFPLTLAMGISHWNPDQDRDVEEALKEADKKMYEQKGE